jgi:hypothetical protein
MSAKLPRLKSFSIWSRVSPEASGPFFAQEIAA